MLSPEARKRSNHENRNIGIGHRAGIHGYLRACGVERRINRWKFGERRRGGGQHDRSGQWFRSFGNELWEFDEHGLMRRREASINDAPILESERKFRWSEGPRPDDYPGLTEMGL